MAADLVTKKVLVFAALPFFAFSSPLALRWR